MFDSIVQNYLTKLYIPSIAWNDIIEIIIFAFIIYKIIAWIKSSKAWSLLKGIVVILIFLIIVYLLQLSTILWVAQRLIAVGLISMVILFQPELRHALEKLGTRNVIFKGLKTSKDYERFAKKTADEIVEACFDMGRDKTGALIVIEETINLDEVIKTGIDIKGIVTGELLINIFEKNTPLHDGAVVLRGDKIMAATCYLPLSNASNIDKALGTRHRAALGISEETDALVIIVSEETGAISIASGGKIERNLDRSKLKARLECIRTHNGSINPITFKERNWG